ncbi:MAG: hypothetical protein WCI12_07810 [Actinomycetes bacterium]
MHASIHRHHDSVLDIGVTDQDWVDDLIEQGPSACRWLSNDAVLVAGRAWLEAKGLAEEISAMRIEGEHGVIPAPGLFGFVDDAERSLREGTEAADLVVRLVSEPGLSDETLRRAAMAAHRSITACDRSSRALRQIAQVGFGVSAMLGPSERVERLDRVAVAALVAPDASGERRTLIEDQMTPQAPDEAALLVELGGLICRMLIDGAMRVRIGQVTITSSHDGVIELRGPEMAENWSSPVPVGGVVRDVFNALGGPGGVLPLPEVMLSRPL